MPWHQESVMTQRLEFCHAVTHRAAGTSILDVCRQFGHPGLRLTYHPVRTPLAVSRSLQPVA
jgi:hypothetical protein